MNGQYSNLYPEVPYEICSPINNENIFEPQSHFNRLHSIFSAFLEWWNIYLANNQERTVKLFHLASRHHNQNIIGINNLKQLGDVFPGFFFCHIILNKETTTPILGVADNQLTNQ
jgi:hypothetical protein